MNQLSNILSKEAKVLEQELMKQHTSFKIGGAADYMVLPGCEEDIALALSYGKTKGIPYFIMGNGSNLLVSDRGMKCMILKMSALPEKLEQIGSCEISVGAGVSLSRLALFAAKLGLSGLEFAQGIPGTVGGALVMNAGAYGGEMKQVVQKTKVLDEEGNIFYIEGEGHEFGYRSSIFSKQSFIVLSTVVQLKPAPIEKIKETMAQFAEQRREKQPLSLPSAGSVFKRPEGHFVGKMVEECELKGFQFGGAQISSLHGGFIVNAGGATSSDVSFLIALIQQKVYEKFGVLLECEIKFVGERER